MRRSWADSFTHTDTYSHTAGNAYAYSYAVGYTNCNTVGNAISYAHRDPIANRHAQSDAAATPDTVSAPHAITGRPVVPVHSDRRSVVAGIVDTGSAKRLGLAAIIRLRLRERRTSRFGCNSCAASEDGTA